MILEDSLKLARVAHPGRTISPKPALVPAPRAALEPQRRPGKLRVAALLRSGAEVIAERGFAAATMAEIAARAGAPIGSLYRFFPSKDALGDALLKRYSELIDEALGKVEYRREVANTEAFADALLGAMVELRGQTQAAVVALLDERSDFSPRKHDFMGAIRRHVVRILRSREPELAEQKAEDMSVVLVQNMKMRKMLDEDNDAGAIAELRAMTRAYLAGALGA